MDVNTLIELRFKDIWITEWSDMKDIIRSLWNFNFVIWFLLLLPIFFISIGKCLIASFLKFIKA